MDPQALPAFPRRMVYNALVACLTSLSIGYVIGSPNVPEASIRGTDGRCGPHPYTIQNGFPNCFEFSDLIWGLAVGSFCLGACFGGLVGGAIQNKVGRIKTMMLSDLIFIIGAITLGLTYHQAQFVVGRIIVGIACGLGGVVAPTYLNEIATAQARGVLGTFHQLFLVVGLLISNLIGLIWSNPPGWRVVMAVNAVPALLQGLILFTLVESPKYLVSRHQLRAAQRSLQLLRGAESESDVYAELKDMALLLLNERLDDEKVAEEDLESPMEPSVIPVQRDDSLATMRSNSTAVQPSVELHRTSPKSTPSTQDSYGILELFRSECRGIAIVGIVIHFLQQASGINGLVYYSTSFLANVFGSGSSQNITIGVSCCNLLATAFSVFLIDRFNRKTLMVASFIGISISSVLLVAGGYSDTGILVVVAVFLYIISFAVGLGPIPWLLLSEMLPTYALSPASSIATGVNWGSNFIIGLVFPSMTKGMGSATFIFFGSVSAFGAFYVWRFVPETRGLSVDQVMAAKGVPSRGALKS
ncbi:hypothetical protein BGZ98_007040 [Dissophora globulifera]|nr:hypothetical protein BGZ98_007040 [Dissophora globulifera]